MRQTDFDNPLTGMHTARIFIEKRATDEFI
jgi:hypothetical protein